MKKDRPEEVSPELKDLFGVGLVTKGQEDIADQRKKWTLESQGIDSCSDFREQERPR